ncbi:glycosyltransferase [Candidatus Gottesmanbacteria bacterium]|nr:glycosyltransferase [Candidatus Gottesmanbacteria bacterium]
MPQAKLAIIGHGTKTKNPGIKSFGFLSDKQARKILKLSKIFLFPSHEEGFGLAPLEGQSFGLPVVAWNLPIYKEIFPQGMILIKENSFNNFTTTIIELLTKNDYHKKVSLEAYENSQRFSWEKYAENFKVLCGHPHLQRRGLDQRNSGKYSGAKFSKL